MIDLISSGARRLCDSSIICLSSARGVVHAERPLRVTLPARRFVSMCCMLICFFSLHELLKCLVNHDSVPPSQIVPLDDASQLAIGKHGGANSEFVFPLVLA